MEFYARLRAGEGSGEATLGVGVPESVGRGWLRQCGGVLPAPLPRTEPSYRRLSIEEREKILAGMARKESMRAIARSIGRAPSTVKREIDTNLFGQKYHGQRRSPSGRKRTTS